MSSFVLCEVSFLCERFLTCFTAEYHHCCLTFTMSPPQFNWCFCKLSFRVYTFSHFSHPNLLSKWVFMCLASSPFPTPLSQTLHFSIVLTFPMCFFKIYAVWNFLSQMLQLDSFFGGILCSACWNKVDCWILFHNQHMILNVHGSKSGSQPKSSKQWVLSIYDRL